MARPQPPQHPPKRNASRQEWYLYAVNRCRYTDAMETMNRAELIAHVEREAPASFRIAGIAHQPERYACGCVVGGPVNCYPTPGRAPEGVVTVHGTPLPEVHDDPWPDVDDEVVHEQISTAVGRGMFTDQVRKLLEGKAAEIETVANGGRTKCPSCGMAYRNSLGHPAHCPPIGREIVEHLPEQIRPSFVDWGRSEYPDERVRADRRAARANRPDPVGLFLEAAWTWLRDNIVAVWVMLGIVAWVVFANLELDPAVAAASCVMAGFIAGAVGYFPLKRVRRERRGVEAARRAAELEAIEKRAKDQDALWKTDPAEYRRRVERGEL
ncbi:hypothetical protein SEA_ZIPP_5 [Gordonia phage Zipp]|uniref:Uncharacterized protein n=1 Tax=Gordonia phage Zipp TaxID=2591212 RepID=A0A514DHS2_9CAUD|nr:hypothetical protein J1775_gp05 [Gordonia phage Zipp]QDH93159.1 hypothetical protein SEA_ZIPP_5 [Gordonia phage Zipp]